MTLSELRLEKGQNHIERPEKVGMACLDLPASSRSFISEISQICRRIRECTVSIFGSVNRYALGAGLEVAVSYDMRVASRGAAFRMPEVCDIVCSTLYYLPSNCFIAMAQRDETTLTIATSSCWNY